jgi:hypothetical protein
MITFPDSAVVVVGEAVHVTSLRWVNNTRREEILAIIRATPGVGLVLQTDFAVVVWAANFFSLLEGFGRASSRRCRGSPSSNYSHRSAKLKLAYFSKLVPG